MFSWLLGKKRADAPSPVMLPESIRPAVDTLLRDGNGNLSAAVKFVRQQTGLSLTDAAIVVKARAREIS